MPTPDSANLAVVITDKVNAMIAYWDKDLVCRFANAAYLDWFGKTNEEMIDKITLQELLGPIFEKNQPYITKALQGELQTFEREIPTPRGIRHSLATYYPNLVNGCTEGFFAHVVDVTSMKLMENELVIEKQNQWLLNYAKILSNQTTELTQVNEELNAANDSLSLLNKQISVAYQIIEQRTSELEQALTKANELVEMKSRLVAMVSHELRSPLAVIALSADMLRTYWDRMTPEQITEKLNKVDKQVLLLEKLLEDVLDFGLFESGKVALKIELVDVNRIRALAEEVMLLHTSHQLRFVQDNLSQLRTDERLIRHIISNLVTNAVKYSPGADEVSVAITSDPTSITLSVKDYGLGIPPDEINDLFSIFHRAENVRHIKGTGLGLSIVKRSTELLNGKITVTSELGKGSEFKVVLPLLN